MVRSRMWLSLVGLMLAAMLVIAGCTGSSKSPQEVLQASMAKSAELKSYSFEGSMTVEDLNFPAGEDSADSELVLSMLKGLNLSWSGVYRTSPMHLEMTLALAPQSEGLAINFSIPIVLEQDKVWVKIPTIPFLPLPEDVADKFLELDLKQLAEESGKPLPSIDPGKSQKLVNDLMGILFNNVNEQDYFADVKPEEAGLPADVDVKQVVRFQVDKERLEPFVQTLVEKIAPEMIKLLSDNAEYRDMLGLKQEDLDSAGKALDEARKEDISKEMDEFRKVVKALDVTANIGIDAKEYPVYTDVRVSADIDADGQPASLAFKIVSQTRDINKDVKLDYPDGPSADEVMTMEQFQQQLGGLFGGIEGL